MLDNTGQYKGTAAKAIDKYSSRTKMIPLKGSGYKSLNRLESEMIEYFGGTMKKTNSATYNIRSAPKRQ